MNTIQDLKGVRLMLLIWVVLSVIVIGGYFGFKQLQKGTTLTNLVQDGLTQNSTFHTEVSAAPTILDKVKDKDIDAKKLDNSSLLYVFNETYENLEFSKKVKDETLANHFTDGKRKLVLFTSHPTTVANYSGVIELNSDWSAKLDNKVFSPRELKFQNTRLKGEYVSGIWFGLFNSEEAERLQKSTFPNAIKVKVKENKYLLVTEGIGEGTYGKTANVSLVDADAIPDDPNNQGAISAIIPGLTDADNKTWTIDERVGEIIYQSDGTVRINSHFTTPNATVKGVLNVRVVSQDKIEATVDHYGEVKCHDPVNFTLHNQDCVALPRDQTPAWKDDKIKELEKQVKEWQKDKEELNKYKADWLEFFGCLEEGSTDYWRRISRYDRRNFNFKFKKDAACLDVKEINWNTTQAVARDDRYNTNEMKITFQENKQLDNPYIQDLISCETRWWKAWVCLFGGKNPTKLTELYLTDWPIGETAQCSYSKSRFSYTCGWAWGWRGTWLSVDWDFFIKEEFGLMSFWGLFKDWQNPVKLTYYKNFFSEFKTFVGDIASYTNTLKESNILGNRDIVKKFKIVGLRYAEPKTYKNYKTDICVTNIGCYGVWDNAETILTEGNWIQTFENAKKRWPWQHNNVYGNNNPDYPRWWVLYQSSRDRRYAKETLNPYEFKNLLLFQ